MFINNFNASVKKKKEKKNKVIITNITGGPCIKKIPQNFSSMAATNKPFHGTFQYLCVNNNKECVYYERMSNLKGMII